MNIPKLEKNKHEYYFVITLAIILVLLVVAIAIVSLNQARTTIQTMKNLPTPVQFTENEQQNINTHISYNKEATTKLLAREEQRIPLAQSDSLAKEHILQLIPAGKNYGIVRSSQTSTIEYVQSLDLFEIEILTINVQQAKNDAENWFKQQGMSQEGICNLPLDYYLNWDVANILKQSNFVFSPLPDGC